MISHTQSEKWLEHLKDRLHQATKIGLLPQVVNVQVFTCGVFTPEGFDPEKLMVLPPDTSLRSLEPTGRSDGHGWIRREDLLDDAAVWMVESYEAVNDVAVVCESGYSRPGDRSLESEPHAVVGGQSFYVRKLCNSTVEEIARTLRKGRSWRTLGVVGAVLVDENCVSCAGPLVFFCDAFEGDSLAFLEIPQFT